MRKPSRKVSRRGALQAGAGLAVGSALGTVNAAPAAKMDVYATLGISPVINATGTVTALGGSLMPPEVIAAWVDAARSFVDLVALQEKVGARIANLIGVEAALVTSGAAGSLLLGTAAAVTRGDPQLARRLPDTAGMRNQVLLQKSHHSCYDMQFTNVGVQLLDVETPADVERVAGPKTALMFFMNFAEASGRIDRESWIALAKKHKVPTLLDAAADVPPLERLSGYCKQGFDLVAFSGGKALRGPNDTGLLLGRKDLIDAVRRVMSPNCPSIGRMMKISKEDLVAQWAAIERFVHLDHAAEWKEWERRLEVVEKALAGLPTVACKRIVPPIANHVPHLIVTWDEKGLQLTKEKLTKELAAGKPSIRLGRVSGTGSDGILVSVFTLREGEIDTVAERLRAILAR